MKHIMQGEKDDPTYPEFLFLHKLYGPTMSFRNKMGQVEESNHLVLIQKARFLKASRTIAGLGKFLKSHNKHCKNK